MSTSDEFKRHMEGSARSLWESFERDRAFDALLRRHDMMPAPSESDEAQMREMGFEPWRPPLKGLGDEG